MEYLPPKSGHSRIRIRRECTMATGRMKRMMKWLCIAIVLLLSALAHTG